MRQILLIITLSIFIVLVSQLIGMTSAKADMALPPTTTIDRGETALMKAIANENETLAKKLLKSDKNIDAKDHAGNTALLYAVSTGSAGLVKAVLNKKPNLKLTYGDSQENVLFEAVRVNSAEIAKLLVTADKSLLRGLNTKGENPLFEAGRLGASETAKYLISQGMSAKMKNKDGKTALQLAQENNLDATVKELQKSK